MNDIKAFMTPAFRKSFKKMYKIQQGKIKKDIEKTVIDPEIGEEKKGALNSVFVHKLIIDQQLILLAYQFDPETRMLLMLESHQIFYKNLKRVVV